MPMLDDDESRTYLKDFELPPFLFFSFSFSFLFSFSLLLKKSKVQPYIKKNVPSFTVYYVGCVFHFIFCHNLGGIENI